MGSDCAGTFPYRLGEHVQPCLGFDKLDCCVKKARSFKSTATAFDFAFLLCLLLSTVTAPPTEYFLFLLCPLSRASRVLGRRRLDLFGTERQFAHHDGLRSTSIFPKPTRRQWQFLLDSAASAWR